MNVTHALRFFGLCVFCLAGSCRLKTVRETLEPAPPPPPEVMSVSFKFDSNPQGAAVYAATAFPVLDPPYRNNNSLSWVGITPCTVTVGILSNHLVTAGIEFITTLSGYHEQRAPWIYKGDTNVLMFTTLQPLNPKER